MDAAVSAARVPVVSVTLRGLCSCGGFPLLVCCGGSVF